ncbi:alkylhydroperoxidase domain protein [Pseudoclavibacter sp. JAI123]|uniref:peroxidase-related enzyme n=1 Tax=Pseudoclavibacter sp. JAI123 TaxID=2723065 RepID=UPI0015C6EA40|nr:peroxidase-related enzyme [Pseudoclavibacter sp. JAI123]NYF13085.1 alkylhydroperoxidase domain protein [Pseudoclavibacter sp. JAI123]
MRISPTVPESIASLTAAKPEVIEQTLAAYSALYEAPQALEATLLHGFARTVARWQGNAQLAEWHLAQGADARLVGDELPADPKLRALVEHVDLITVSPALATHEDQHVLPLTGITPDEIVLLSQLVAFESYLARMLDSDALLAGRSPERVDAPARSTVAAGRSKDLSGRTISGLQKPTAYTQEQLEWSPWIAAPAEDELTPEQVDSFAAKATTNSVYFRLLSRVPAVLKARSAIDNAVFLSKDGLPRAERELAAAVASKVNDCIYCASVHSRKATFQSKRHDDVQRVIDASLPRDANWQPTSLEALSAGQDARWSAIIRFAASLSTLRPSATPSQIEELRDLGLDDAELFDLVGSTAFFAWANRLMLSLGEPNWPASAASAS